MFGNYLPITSLSRYRCCWSLQKKPWGWTESNRMAWCMGTFSMMAEATICQGRIQTRVLCFAIRPLNHSMQFVENPQIWFAYFCGPLNCSVSSIVPLILGQLHNQLLIRDCRLSSGNCRNKPVHWERKKTKEEFPEESSKPYSGNVPIPKAN